SGARRGAPSVAIDNRFLFQGHLYDPLTRTYAMRARQYKPAWGRFLSPDPISIAGGPSLYSFTGSRPLSYRDPSGLGPFGMPWPQLQLSADGGVPCSQLRTDCGSGTGRTGSQLPDETAPQPAPPGIPQPGPPSPG